MLCGYTHATWKQPVYGELLFRQATWHATLLHPFLYVIDFKRALGFGEAQVRLPFVNSDMRFMQGVFRGTDGKVHQGAFAFV